MKIIKKINNNVAEAIDGNGNHLIAFGKGLGFPKTPYELTDLNKITMTFYKLSEYFEGLLREIPEEILNLSAEIVSMAQEELNGQLNPTFGGKGRQNDSGADTYRLAERGINEYHHALCQ